MENMTELQIALQEKQNTGTSWSRNKKFDEKGFLFLENLWDPTELYHPLPKETGQINYFGSLEKFNHIPEECQVVGSLARYTHPQYKHIHNGIRLKVEKIIGRKLHNTYYYDRFYKSSMSLANHLDRDACEVSVTVHISTDLKTPWPIWIKGRDTYLDDKKEVITKVGENQSVVMNSGDGLLYYGCERPHWREPMPYGKGFFGNNVEKYFHQIFFHYCLADGIRSHCAFDASR